MKWKKALLVSAIFGGLFVAPALYMLTTQRWIPLLKADAASKADPYYAELVQHSECAGTMREMIRFIYARASDGTRVEAEFRGEDRAAMVRHILRPSGLLQTVHDAIAGVTSIAYDYQREMVGSYNPATDCAQKFAGSPPKVYKYLGEDTLLGFRVVQYAANSAGTDTMWRAPDLGCIIVSQDINLAAHSVTTPIKLSAEEPPAWLFEIPSNYKEMGPTEGTIRAAKARHLRLYGKELSGAALDEATRAITEKTKRREAHYNSSQR